MSGRHQSRWLDDPAHVTLLFRLLGLVCLGLVAADFFLETEHHFVWETWPGFHVGFGFTVFCLIVFAGKLLRKLVMRREDYYDRG